MIASRKDMPAANDCDLRVHQVSLILNCSRRTIYRLVGAGKLPAHKVGRDWRFRPKDVDAFRRPKEVTRFNEPKTRVQARVSGAQLPGWYFFAVRPS